MSGKEKKEKKPKEILTPEEKKARSKKRTKKALIITGVVILLIGCLIGTFALVTVTGNEALTNMAASFAKVDYSEVASGQLQPVLDSDGHWTFTTDRDFKIVQLTDVHIGAGFASQKKDSWAVNAVASMVTAEKPDLVIVTGDIAYPVPFQSGTFNNLNATKIFARLMETLGVYWTFAFGNHDTEAYSYYDRKDICDWYASQDFKYCLFKTSPIDSDDNGYGNQIIKVKNSSGLYTQALTVFDSHSYTDNDYFGALWKYDNIHKEQEEWYAEEMDKLKAANVAAGGADEYVPNLMYFHIPLREYREAAKELTESGFKVTDNVKYIYGNLGEKNQKNSVGEQTYGVFCGIKQDTVFETGKAHGLQGIFCGHDHYNNFSVIYKGIRLTYGMSIDYLAYMGIYKEGAQRGCTIITVQPDGAFDCVPSNYYTDKYQSVYEKEKVDLNKPYKWWMDQVA